MLARGALLKLTKIPDNVERDEIKTAFSTFPADIAHVEITDDRNVIVRLRGENDAAVVIIDSPYHVLVGKILLSLIANM